MVLNEEYEPMADRDTISMGEIYNIFVKDKPVYLTLKFNGVFNLYEGNKLVSVCGYKCDRNMEEKMSDIYIDTLYVEKLYKKGYRKIRSDLYYEEVTKQDMNEDVNELYISEDSDDSDEGVLEEFIEIFIKNFCRGINNIVFCDKLLYKER
jgi:hypothetical protein